MDLSKILFFDIETIPQFKSFDKAPEADQKLWAEKAQYLLKTDEDTVQSIYGRAGIYAEFGRIVCISVGFISEREGNRSLRLKSYYGDDEKQLLGEFAELLSKHFNGNDHLLCGHNGREFDFPYIARRMIVHQIELPSKLNLFGKKPWEIPHLDTMELWKFGDYKHYSSLQLLTSILGIPSPKDDIEGSHVAKVYYKDKDLDRIVSYCEKDTIAVAQLLIRFNNEKRIDKNEITKV